MKERERVNPPDPNRPPNREDYPNLKRKEAIFQSVEELEPLVDEFFETLAENTEEVMSASGSIKEIKRPLMPTIEGLCAFLRITRQTLNNMEGRPEFEEYIRLTKDRILGHKAQGLVNGKGSTTGIIFDMVNNHGYKNKAEVESKSDNTTRIVVEFE